MRFLMIIAFMIIPAKLCFLFSQNDDVRISYAEYDFSDELHENKIVLAKVNKLDTAFEILCYNNTNDTMYLFDSYIDNIFYKAKYLHHYNKKEKRHLISFLPIMPYIAVRRGDLFVAGSEKLVSYNQILYHFTVIKPRRCIAIYFPVDLLKPDNYIKEINIKELDRYSKFEYKTIHENNIDIKSNIIQFAVYKNIKVFEDTSLYYVDESKFNNMAQKYIIVEVRL